MLTDISWQQFLIFLLIANAIYYAFIWIVYFKAKLPSLAGFGRISTPSFHGEDQPDEVLTTTQHIIDELKPLFPNKRNKNELILALQSALNRYSGWEEPGFRDSINEYIAEQSECTCSIRLSEADLRAIWSKA